MTLYFKFHTQLKVTAQRTKLLDMAPDVIDDIYSGCREEAMDKFIHSGLLKQELSGNIEFQDAWNASAKCQKLIPGRTKEHTAALLAYANENPGFKKTFSDAVETLGVNVSTYEDHFHFKSLHFLLMDSMTQLMPKCKTVYFVSEEKYTVQNGSSVRFGGFTVAHSSYATATELEDLDDQVLFNISSCFLADMRDICTEGDKVLLSPAEVFTVEEVNKVTDANDAHYTLIVLKHSKLDSSHNCYIFSR